MRILGTKANGSSEFDSLERHAMADYIKTSKVDVTVLLVLTDPRRVRLARMLVNRLILQPFFPFEIMIVNSTAFNVLTVDTDNDVKSAIMRNSSIREISVTPGLPVGTMRNYGISQACGEWILPVDDDDYFHSLRLIVQMSRRRHGKPCMFKRQTLVDVSAAVKHSDGEPVKPEIYIRESPIGVPATVMFERVHEGELVQYDESLEYGENEELLARVFGPRSTATIIDNRFSELNAEIPWSLMSVGIWHGSNLLSRDRFFVDAVPQWEASEDVRLNTLELHQLRSVFAFFNFQLGVAQ